jgi:hypothetical protein
MVYRWIAYQLSSVVLLVTLLGCTHMTPVTDTGFPELMAIQYRGTNFVGGTFSGNGSGLTNISNIQSAYWSGTINGTNVQYGFTNVAGTIKFKVVIGTNEVTIL